MPHFPLFCKRLTKPQANMKVLFVHQNFPGQYRHVATALANNPNNVVVAIGEARNVGRLAHPRITEIGYKTPEGASNQTHHYLRSTEAGVRRGQQVIRVADELLAKGFEPDVICCHPAWGEGLFLRDVWSKAKLLYFFEFFYHAHGRDTGFDPEFPQSRDSVFKTRTRNSIHLMSLDSADWGITPTRWQHSSLPKEYQSKVSVIFDGVDTDVVKPNDSAELEISDELILSCNDEVITFINRNLEPYRGYHQFMRALPKLMKARPNAHFVLLGGDGVSYGTTPSNGETYKQKYLDEVSGDIDLERLHFLGRVSYEQYLNVIQVSTVHVYLTYPFVLSWSLIETMSAGCAIVASATPPVKEVIEHGAIGLLFEFFDTDALVEQVCRVLDHPDSMIDMRKAARASAIKHYDLKQVCLPKQLALIETVAQS